MVLLTAAAAAAGFVRYKSIHVLILYINLYTHV